jgi:hypothetical protein
MSQTSSSQDQAKHVLMDSFGVSSDQADDLLRHWARACHRSTETVAQVLVHQIWAGDTLTCDRTVARVLEDALRNLPEMTAASNGGPAVAGASR